MANLFNQNPMILDTVWTSGTIPAALTALTSWQDFSLIKLVNPAAAGDECKITDASAGTFVLFDEFAVAAHQDVVLWDAAAQGGKKYSFKKGLWVLATLTATDKVYLWR
jgi:hypothetical protein